MHKKEGPYQLLDQYTGTWKTRGLLYTEDDRQMEVYGTDTYEWLPGGYFLLHKADVMMGENRSQTYEIIGYDAVTGHYTMQYYESSGISGQMIAIHNSGEWVFSGEDLQFTGSFSDDGNTISGRWETLNGNTWLKFMEIRLERVKS